MKAVVQSIRRRCVTATTVLAILTAAAAASGAWEWPLSTFRVDAGFAQPRDGAITTAVWLSAQEPAVGAAHPGEVVFTRVEGEAVVDGTPHGYGNFVVLQHEDGLRSIYSNMGAVGATDAVAVEQGDTLGTVGVSGFAYGDQLGFHMIDEELGRLVNPFVILPPVDDGEPPVIQGVFLRRDDTTIPVSRETELDAETTFDVFVEAYDTAETTSGTRRVPPKSITVTLGDGEPRSVSFDTMEYVDGRFHPAGGRPVDTLYAAEGQIHVAELTIGTEAATLTVRVEDFAGNRTSAEYRILPRATGTDDDGTAGSR